MSKQVQIGKQTYEVVSEYSVTRNNVTRIRMIVKRQNGRRTYLADWNANGSRLISSSRGGVPTTCAA